MQKLWPAVALIGCSQGAIAYSVWTIFNMIEPYVVCYISRFHHEGCRGLGGASV